MFKINEHLTEPFKVLYRTFSSKSVQYMAFTEQENIFEEFTRCTFRGEEP